MLAKYSLVTAKYWMHHAKFLQACLRSVSKEQVWQVCLPCILPMQILYSKKEKIDSEEIVCALSNVSVQLGDHPCTKKT